MSNENHCWLPINIRSVHRKARFQANPKFLLNNLNKQGENTRQTKAALKVGTFFIRSEIDKQG